MMKTLMHFAKKVRNGTYFGQLDVLTSFSLIAGTNNSEKQFFHQLWLILKGNQIQSLLLYSRFEIKK